MDGEEIESSRLNTLEQALVETYVDRLRESICPPRIEKGKMVIPEKDGLLGAQLMKATGSVGLDFGMHLLGTLANACGVETGHLEKMNPLIEGICGIAPRDEAEGLLSAQLVALYWHTMKSLQVAAHNHLNPYQYTTFSNQAVKLARTYAALLESLGKYRSGGQQKMTVEHVHVHNGGQAIVGQVQGGRGGKNEK